MRHITASLLTAAALAAGAAAQFGKEGATCGGIAALQCAAGFSCKSNDNDRCNPATGGADCAGICKAEDGGSGNGGGGGGTGSGSGEGQSCGGISAKGCPAGYECVDDPSDTCDPTKGGADCPSICKAKSGGGGGGGASGSGSASASYSLPTMGPGPVSISSKPYPTGGNGTAAATTTKAATTTGAGAPGTSTSVILSTASGAASASSAAASPGLAAPGLVVDSFAWAAVGLGVLAGL